MKKYSIASKVSGLDYGFVLAIVAVSLVLTGLTNIRMENPYWMGEDFVALVDGRFFHPLRMYVLFGMQVSVLGFFFQLSGPLDFYQRSQSSERYSNYVLITLLYYAMFIGGILVATYASYYAPRASIGKEISVYTYLFPDENFFSNIIATLFGGIICLIATSMAIGEIKRRKAFIEID